MICSNGKGKSEHRIQQEIVIEFNNRYPQYRGLLCYNNNNSEGGYRGSKNKYLGLIPGRSDLVFYFDGKAHMIELKTETGKQSQTQKNWESLITENGFDYYIVRSCIQFFTLINKIIKGEI